MGIQRMDCVADNLARHEENDQNLNCATAFNVNPDITNTRRPPEGGSNVMKSPRKSVKFIEHAESTTQKWEVS
jgi:hypothetical protein